MIEIILLISSINTGDVSHADAIYTQIERLSAEKSAPKILSKHVIDANLSSEAIQAAYQKLSADQASATQILLAIGEKGLNALEALRHAKLVSARTFVAGSVHQFFDNIKPTFRSLAANFLN